MNPGTLRERVDVQRPTETRNALGEVNQDWQTVATRFASVQSMSIREAMNAQQTGLSVTHKVRMRYLSGLSSRDRLQWRGRTLQIVSVLEWDNLSVHELICEEQA